jgi:integrase
MPEDHLKLILLSSNPLQIHLYTLLTLCFYTLIRPRETLTLCWKHILLNKKYVHVPLSKNDQFGVGTYVTLLPPALLAISSLSAATNHSPNDLVFPIRQEVLNPWLQAKCSALNLPLYNWYATKHGGATYLALLGWSLPHIQSHGRWHSKEAAQAYIHAPVRPA